MQALKNGHVKVAGVQLILTHTTKIVYLFTEKIRFHRSVAVMLRFHVNVRIYMDNKYKFSSQCILGIQSYIGLLWPGSQVENSLED